MSEPSTTYQGWTFVIGSLKWHYFRNEKKSLCRKWLILGLDPDRLEDTFHGSKDNCKACRRVLEKNIAVIPTEARTGHTKPGQSPEEQHD